MNISFRKFHKNYSLDWFQPPPSMKLSPVKSFTPSITVEDFRMDHAKGLWNIIENEPDIWKLYPIPTPTSWNDFENTIISKIIKDREAKQAITFVMRSNIDNKVIGSSRFLFVDPQNKSLEIGFTFYNRDRRRTSCNTETKLLLLTHAFEVLGCQRVQFKTDLRNIASQRAMQRIGAVQEGIMRKFQLLWNGHQRYSVIFSIIDDEWKQVKANLESKLFK